MSLPTLYATFVDMRSTALSDPLHRLEVVPPKMEVGFAGATTQLAGIVPFGGCRVTVAEYVPASALDAATEALRAANERLARLRAALEDINQRALTKAHLTKTTCEACQMGEVARAALAPKEPSDV